MHRNTNLKFKVQLFFKPYFKHLIAFILSIFPIVLNAQSKTEIVFRQLFETEMLAANNKDSSFLKTTHLIEFIKKEKSLPDSLLAYAYYIASDCKRYGAEYEKSLVYLDSSMKYTLRSVDLINTARIYHGKGNILLQTGKFDSALYYYRLAIDLRKSLNLMLDLSKSIANLGVVYFKKSQYDSALHYYTESLRIRTTINDSSGIVSSLSNIGNVHLYQNNFNEAASYYLKAKELVDTTKSFRQLASILNNIGNIYNRQGNYYLALENFMQAIKWYESLGDRAAKARISNNVALIHFEQGNIDLAMQYHTEALALFTEIKDSYGIADTYYYSARIYHYHKDFIKAKSFFQTALEMKKELGDVSGIADCLQNLGAIYLDTHKYDSALICLKQANSSYVKIQNKYGQAVALNNMAEVNLQTKKITNAYSFANKALKIAESYSGLNEMMLAYSIMANAREKQGRYNEALALTRQAMLLKDSLFNQNKTKTIMELESKYQLERKEQAIEMQQVQLEKRDLEFINKEIEIKWQKKLRNMFLILAALLSILVLWLIRNLIYSKALQGLLAKQRNDIILKNENLEQLNEEFRIQQEQIVKQNDVLLTQNIKIEEANHSFKESVHYAEYIQQAVLPSKQRLNSIIPNHFVLYIPKDIVGGDFYWVHRADSKIVLAVGDCTGHGVPGGFLSMLSLAFLKEIVTVQHIYKTNLVLDALRNQVIDSLQQSSELLEHIDGIDISLLVIDEEEKTIEYSGAKSKIVIIDEQSALLLKGDRMPVGYSPKMKPFGFETLPFDSNKTYYLFTDGFIDQYNTKDEKFGITRFIDLCKSNYSKPLSTQKEIFYQSFQNWKGNFEQIDDVTVLAINI